jgi:hypothetical protein
MHDHWSAKVETRYLEPSQRLRQLRQQLQATPTDATLQAAVANLEAEEADASREKCRMDCQDARDRLSSKHKAELDALLAERRRQRAIFLWRNRRLRNETIPYVMPKQAFSVLPYVQRPQALSAWWNPKSTAKSPQPRRSLPAQNLPRSLATVGCQSDFEVRDEEFDVIADEAAGVEAERDGQMRPDFLAVMDDLTIELQADPDVDEDLQRLSGRVSAYMHAMGCEVDGGEGE